MCALELVAGVPGRVRYGNLEPAVAGNCVAGIGLHGPTSLQASAVSAN